MSDSRTIAQQAKIIEALLTAVRDIALMDEVDAALDPTWPSSALIRHGKRRELPFLPIQSPITYNTKGS